MFKGADASGLYTAMQKIDPWSWENARRNQSLVYQVKVATAPHKKLLLELISTVFLFCGYSSWRGFESDRRATKIFLWDSWLFCTAKVHVILQGSGISYFLWRGRIYRPLNIGKAD